MKRLLLLAIPAVLAACAESPTQPDSRPNVTQPTAPHIEASATAANQPKLTFFKGGGASIGWSTIGGSSPGDNSNSASIRIVTPTGSDAGAYTYGKDEAANTIVGRKLSAIDHLGFDSKGYLGNGAPRISLITTGTDGNHTYFLSAHYCNETANPSDWVTSDFVHNSTCDVFRDNEPTPYLGLAGAAVVADANNEHVTDWFLIQDEAATVYVDRLTVQDWMWVRSGSLGIRSCLDVNPSCI
jgi:hypothetical protein